MSEETRYFGWFIKDEREKELKPSTCYFIHYKEAVGDNQVCTLEQLLSISGISKTTVAKLSRCKVGSTVHMSTFYRGGTLVVKRLDEKNVMAINCLEEEIKSLPKQIKKVNNELRKQCGDLYAEKESLEKRLYDATKEKENLKFKEGIIQ